MTSCSTAQLLNCSRPEAADWLSLAEAASLLGMSERHVRRLCVHTWSQRGLATLDPSIPRSLDPSKRPGRPNWLIHRSASPRLSRVPSRDTRNGSGRDALIARYPAHRVERAYEKAHWLERWSALQSRDRTGATEAARIVVAEAKTKHGPKYPISVRGLRKWKSLYENLGPNGQVLGVAALVDKYVGPGTKGRRDEGTKGESRDSLCNARSPEAIVWFYDSWRSRKRLSIKTCHEITLLDSQRFGWTWPPSVSATARWLREHDDLAKTCLFRDGPAAWTHRYMPFNEIDYSAWQPGQFYQMDHSQLDLWCTDGGVRSASLHGDQFRPWLTVCQDVRSRMIVGWWIGPSPHQDAILCALRAAFRDFAIPQRMRIDNGRDYTSQLLLGTLSDSQVRALRDEYGGDWRRVVKRDAHLVPLEDSRFLGVVNELGVEVTKAIPYSPWSKGIVERYFGTVHDQFDKGFATYCGNSACTRPDVLNDIRRGYTKAQKRALRRKHGKDWKRAAVLKFVDQSHVPTIDRVREEFAEWLELHHQTGHGGLDGASPLSVWGGATSLRRALEDELMFLMDLRGSYKVGPNGVRLKVGQATIGFDGPCLRALRGRHVLVSIDSQDVSCAYAFDTGERKDSLSRRRYLGKLVPNERIPYGSTADDVRTAIADKRREQGAIKKAARLQVNRFKTSSQRLREHQRERLTALRATGTLDSVPSSLRPSVPSIIPVPIDLDGVSTALRGTASLPPLQGGIKGGVDSGPDYDFAELCGQDVQSARAIDDDEDWEELDPEAPEEDDDDDDDDEEEEWEDFDDGDDADVDGGLYDD